MDVRVYENLKLPQTTKTDSTNKSSDDSSEETKKSTMEKYVKDLVDLSEKAKESRKQFLLKGILNTEDVSETDSLSKFIDKLKEQRINIKSKMSNFNSKDRKTLQGQLSFVDMQLQTLELKQIEIKRAEVGLS